MPWTINSEIYPLWARGTCNSIAATACWTSNLIISFTFLSMTEAITTYGRCGCVPGEVGERGWEGEGVCEEEGSGAWEAGLLYGHRRLQSGHIVLEQ